MIRSTTVAGTAASALLALVAAGCGTGAGRGADHLTRHEFVAQADAICAEYTGKIDNLGEPASQAELGTFIRRAKDLAADQFAALRELEPPGEIEKTVNEAYALAAEQLALFDDLGDATDANDQKKMREISDELDALDVKSDSLAVEIGLKECGAN